MLLESILQTYGYWALLIGTFFEGETILIIAGFAARRGYLDLPLVILAAFAGTLASDQLFFFIGRKRGMYFIERKPSWKPAIGKVLGLLARHRVLLVIGFRFLYGMRTVTPFVIGASSVPTFSFILLNIVGALLWAVTIGTAGYLFGTAFEALLGDIKHIELEVIIVIAATGLIVWCIHFLRKIKSLKR